VTSYLCFKGSLCFSTECS